MADDPPTDSPRRPTQIPHAAQADIDADVTPDPSPTEDPGAASKKAKGKAKAIEPLERCRLLALPTELIASILSYLTPVELNRVSETCQALYRHATDDHLWQAHVQKNVPGQHLTSPYPRPSFRDLFWAHEPRWFLTRCKIWFSDAGLAGRLIVARYDQRRGCIEGYQLLARNTDTSHTPWQPDGLDHEALICGFAPELRLHLDNPVLALSADSHKEEDEVYGRSVLHMSRQRRRSEGAVNDRGAESSFGPTQLHSPRSHSKNTAFQTEIPMRRSSESSLQSSFIHARRLTFQNLAERFARPFPYGHAWPPPSIPSEHHVLGAGLDRPGRLRPEDSAVRRHEVYTGAFRIRKWLDMWDHWHPVSQFLHGDDDPYVPPITIGPLAAFQPFAIPPIAHGPGIPPIAHGAMHIPETLFPRLTTVGEEIATYATLGPALYTPTPTKPFRGIWVGDYGGHGCEFLWINQPDDDDDLLDTTTSLDDNIPRPENESDEDYAARKRDAAIYRGSLKAVKLTGDPNVPRGEVTFVADDLGDGGFVRVAREEPFEGVRVVRSRGHVAHNGFVNDTYIDGQLLLISPDRLAHYWIEMNRVSYFHRVDIDQFLVPE